MVNCILIYNHRGSGDKDGLGRVAASWLFDSQNLWNLISMTVKSPKSRSPLPMVALVGRPNVGKSTLFNRLVGRRKAIVLDTPGLTRDRNFEKAEWAGRQFMAIDTGGYEPDAKDDMRVAMREQAMFAMEEADVLIFMVDVRAGMTPADAEVMDVLRRTRKPVLLAVNKCDNQEQYNEAFAFAELGIDGLFPIAANAGHGVGELLDEVIAQLPEAPRVEFGGEDDIIPRIAIVGRQNVGKSTLVNQILGEKRVIAGPVPGTTRDSIDSLVEVDGKPYIIVDTAGIRRRGRIQQGVEKLSVLRSSTSMDRADLAVILIDAGEGLTEQDGHVAGMAVEQGCAAIFAVNKWDLVEKDTATAGAWAKKLRHELPFISYAPILFLSALTGQRVTKLFELIERILPHYRREISTSEFNKFLEKAVAKNTPPTRKGKSLKINYGTQIGSSPPTFAVFVNEPKLFHFSYERYLINQLREEYGFEGTPVRIRVRKKN